MSNILTLLEPPFQLDIAVLCLKTLELKYSNPNSHIINLDPIEIDEKIFKRLFYSSNNFFKINKLNEDDAHLEKYISFHQKYRTVSQKPFHLLYELYNNIEKDLNININMLSTNTLISLDKEISAIKTLSNLSPSNIAVALNWPEIITSLQNQFHHSKPARVNTVLTISVCFMSPTENVHPTIVKLNYKTNIKIF
jgi:hypothetical protein